MTIRSIAAALALFAAVPTFGLRDIAGAQSKAPAAHQYVVSVSGMT
jgi:hypothetical protein